MQVDPSEAGIPRRTGPDRLRRRELARKSQGWGALLANPRSTVLVVLAAVLGLGGGRRWWLALKARRGVARLSEPDVTVEEVETTVGFGREGLIELFRLLETAKDPSIRGAAGLALSTLWKQDQLIPEEEKAIVRRGYSVEWHARRRYPRGLAVPIPISVTFGVPFLGEDRAGIRPSDLEWSHRIINAGRAALETFSPWTSGPGRVSFSIEPGDFPGNGQHRIVLHARVRTAGLTSNWDLDLPQIPFSFEFDNHLAVDALLTLPDESRGERIARALRLEAPETADDTPRFLDLGPDLAIRNPPEVVVDTPLPSDLAHRLELEFEGLDGRTSAGVVVLGGQATKTVTEVLRIPVGPLGPIPPTAGFGPGEHRVRAILTADPGLGWADPDVRSVWPGRIETDWMKIAIIRK